MGSRRGIFLTLEGGEGSGKTTQQKLIVAYLRERGHEVLEAREPGGTEAGELVRDILLHRVDSLNSRAELALYLASRAQLVEEVVRPGLEAGVSVVCDRFADSSTAYQGGARDLGIEWVERLNSWAIQDVDPDLTLYFDVDPREGLTRRETRGGGSEDLDRIEREGLGFHDRVREAYRVIAGRHPDRFRVIPTDGGADAVWERVRATLDEKLSEWEARP
jgi:dTMP kinase